MNQQIICIEISQAEHTTSLLTIIGKLYPSSYPQRTTTPLTQPQPPSSISLTPIPPNTWAHYYQLTTCLFHNNGLPFVADRQDGCTLLQLHVQQLHTPAFLSLPHNQLTTISWTRCCTECSHIFRIPTDLTLHQESCPIYTSKPPAQPTNQAPSQPTTNHSNNSQWALVFQICPPNCHNDLNEVITNLSISKQPLMEITQNILELVTNWFLTTVPTQPTANSGTTHINND